MPRLMGFFDCFLIRRFLNGDEAGRFQDEQGTAHRNMPRSGYRAEPIPIPTARSQAEATGSPLPSTAYDRTPERPTGDDQGTELARSEGRLNSYSQTNYEIALENQQRSRESTPILDIARSLSGSSVYPCSDDDLSFSDFNDKCDSDGDGDSRLECYRIVSTHTADQETPRLSGRDMDVIGALFPHRDLHPIPKEIKWRDFKQTMTQLGFSVTPTNGANHRFSVSTPHNWFPVESRGKNITAHKPHGTSLSQGEIRRIGQRMRDAYGWSAQTFIST